MMMMIIIMSMGLHYVLELSPPTGLLFIPQMLCEHAGTWWNDVDRGKLLILPSELSGNPTSRIIR
jgi:hypothetical protein